jgi:hypothetical protein
MPLIQLVIDIQTTALLTELAMPRLGRVLHSLFEPGITTITVGTPAASSRQTDEEYLTLNKKATDGTKPSGKKAPLPALATPDVVISPAFKLVVWLVFALIVLTAAALVFLALQPSNSNLQTVMNLIGAAFSGAVGALLGLIGGKAIT